MKKFLLIKKFLKSTVSFVCILAMIISSLGIMPAMTAYARNAVQPLADKANTSDAATVYFGKKGGEPYVWRVIGYDGNGAASKAGSLTLLASRNFEQYPFSSKGSHIYADSALKPRVDGIADNLSDQEKEAILKRTLVHGVYVGNETDCIAGNADLTDILLWPLSAKEAKDVDLSIRMADPAHTEWEDSCWWLRSPAEESRTAHAVKGDGSIFSNWVSQVYGIRPAFYLNPESVLIVSAAKDGKLSGDVGADAMKPVASASNEYKLTILDKSRDFKVLSSEYNKSAHSVEIEYIGASVYNASTAPNEYISAIIKDSNDEVKYYGRVLRPGTANGSFKVDFSGVTVSDTDKFYVFSEQYNGDKSTDYASALVQVNVSDASSGHSEYGITVINNGNGTATASKIMAAGGEEITLKANADSGYHFKEWQPVSPTSGVTIENNKFIMPNEAVRIKAVFEQDAPTEHAITVENDGNGTAGADKSKAVRKTTITLTANANIGYHFKEWQVISPSTLIITGKTFTMPDEEVRIKAIFEQNTPPSITGHNITVENDGNGTANADKSSAEKDTKINLTASANSGYHFKEWQVISPAGLTITGNTFVMPDSDVRVKAIFEQDTQPSGNPLADKANTSDAATVYIGENGGTPYAWRVIAYDGNGAAGKAGSLTLLASGNLDQTRFAKRMNNAYASGLLKIKVDETADKMSEKEKEAIVKRTLSCGSEIGGEVDWIAGDADLTDVLLWPLSAKEAKDVDLSIRMADPANPDWNSSGWWLRSPGFRRVCAGTVSGYGNIIYNTEIFSDTFRGVRPAFYLNQGSILFTSAAEGGKYSGAVGADALKPVAANAKNEYKLTLLDESRSFKVSSSEYNSSARSVRIQYTGATAYDAAIAPNEYISAMIKDSNGNIKYYGRILQPESSAGSVAINFGDVAIGKTDRFYVFSEQYNGDKFTDYASALVPVDLPASPMLKGYGKTVENDGNVTANVNDTSKNGSGITSNTEKANDAAVASKITVKTKQGKDKTATAEISGKMVENAINKSKEEAKVTSIKIKADIPKGADKLRLNITESALEKIAGEKVNNLIIESPILKAVFDKKAVFEIKKSSKRSFTLSISPAEKLSKKAESQIGGRPVYDISISYLNGKKKVTNFKKGTLTVSIPYSLRKNEKADRLCAVYVDKKGKVRRVKGSAYDDKSRSMVFTTNHLATFGIEYTDSGENLKFAK